MSIRQTTRLKIVTVGSEALPDGDLSAIVESEGVVVVAVRNGEISPELEESLNRKFAHLFGSGLLAQQWPGPPNAAPAPQG